MKKTYLYIHFPIFSTLFNIIFIILKLHGIITWSWVWVLMPIWISWISWISALLIFTIVIIMCHIWNK